MFQMTLTTGKIDFSLKNSFDYPDTLATSQKMKIKMI